MPEPEYWEELLKLVRGCYVSILLIEALLFAWTGSKLYDYFKENVWRK